MKLTLTELAQKAIKIYGESYKLAAALHRLEPIFQAGRVVEELGRRHRFTVDEIRREVERLENECRDPQWEEWRFLTGPIGQWPVDLT